MKENEESLTWRSSEQYPEGPKIGLNNIQKDPKKRMNCWLTKYALDQGMQQCAKRGEINCLAV